MGSYSNKRIEWWAADIRFALDQLTIIYKMKPDNIPLRGKLSTVYDSNKRLNYIDIVEKYQKHGIESKYWDK